jgi:hypothetical protein
MPAEGVLAILLAAAVLDNRLTDGAAVPMVFGVWLMAAGALRAGASVEPGLSAESGTASKSRGAEIGFRLALLLIGALGAALGMYGFFRPPASAPGIAALLGSFFIAQSVGVAALGAGALRRRTAGKAAVNKAAERVTAIDEAAKAAAAENEAAERITAIDEAAKAAAAENEAAERVTAIDEAAKAAAAENEATERAAAENGTPPG